MAYNVLIHFIENNQAQEIHPITKASNVIASDLSSVQGHIDNSNIHMSNAEKTKLEGIETGAEKNQNAFSTINNVVANSKSDSVTIKGGIGINITTNPASKEIEIEASGDAVPGAHASTHALNGSDPVSLDKSQVGLGNVTNDKQATKTEFDSHTEIDATTTVRGHVQLSNSTNSTSETLSATPKAVKDSMDGHAIDSTAHVYYGTASGTNAKTLTLSPAPTSLFDGLGASFKNTTQNSGAVTLNVNGRGAKPVVKADGSPLASGDLKANSIYTVRYNGTSFILQGEGGDEVQVDFNNYNPDLTVEDFYPSGTIKNITDITQVPYSRMETAKLGSSGLFCGGLSTGGDAQTAVYRYNDSLIRSTLTASSVARLNHIGASVGNYALFAGGVFGGGGQTDVVDAYNSSFTRSNPTPLSIARDSSRSASVGNYTLIITGVSSNVLSYRRIDAYNTSLTRSTPTALPEDKSAPLVASVGNYAIIAGGAINGIGAVNSMYAYNTSLTRTTGTNISTARANGSGENIGDYAILAGGGTDSGATSAVDAYNTSLTKVSITNLSSSHMQTPSGSVGDYAVFVVTTTLNTYDTNLVRTTSNLGSSNIDSRNGVVAGNTLLFGVRGSMVAFRPEADFSDIPVSSGSSYKFQDDASEKTATSSRIRVRVPATGYIKYKKGVVS